MKIQSKFHAKMCAECSKSLILECLKTSSLEPKLPKKNTFESNSQNCVQQSAQSTHMTIQSKPYTKITENFKTLFDIRNVQVFLRTKKVTIEDIRLEL